MPRESKENIRAFIAVPVPDDVRAELADFQKGLKSSIKDARWARPDGFHVTMKFLGDVSTGQVERIKEALEYSLAGFRSFEMAFGGAGVFPKSSSARVLWVGASQGEGNCRKLNEVVEQPLKKIGVAPDKRRFSVHLTLARFKTPRRVSADILESRFETSLFTVSRVILYKSVLRPGGAEHSPIATFTGT